MKRIISRLDIKGDWLVKGVHLEGLRAIGQPEDFSKSYYQAGADEIVMMDVVASLYQRNSLYDLAEKLASEVFVPIAMGGGIRSIDNIKTALRSGADKVIINTAAHENPEFVNEAARKFGSSTIVVAIEAINVGGERYECFTDNGREHTGREVVAWAEEVASRGAGEIIVTSVDREGTGRGFDLTLTNQITKAVILPVIAHGGAGKPAHVYDALTHESEISAVCIASMLHYRMAREKGTETVMNSVHVGANLKRNNIEDMTLPELKAYLVKANVPIRKVHARQDIS